MKFCAFIMSCAACASIAFAATDTVKPVDVLVVGGGTGGVTAAMAAAQGGVSVALLEETPWVGGQFTSQGLPAPDENGWREQSPSRSYDMYRRLCRFWYFQGYTISDAARAYEFDFDPGHSWVTPVGHEPKVANWALAQLMKPALDAGNLEVFTNTKVTTVSLERPGLVRTVTAVTTFPDGATQTTVYAPKYVVEATLLGDFLEQAQVPFNVGLESFEQTGEPDAYRGAPDPQGVQGFTYCFMTEFCEGENHTIDKPALYDKFHHYYSLRGFPFRHKTAEHAMPFWQYRRLVSWRSFDDERLKNDIAVMNWSSNDYHLRDLISALPVEREEIHYEAKQLSLGFLYWMQTECPRDPQDGNGNGYPELKLRADMLGTTDGLAMEPYIRESRRIAGLDTMKQGDITSQTTFRARLYDDAVAIGCYYTIDIHSCVGDDKRNQKLSPQINRDTQPFQIPLGALIPKGGGNVLAGQKNLSVTHVANGSTRLHPVEWNIGEAAGTVAAQAVKFRTTPEQIRADKTQLRRLQETLVRNGIPIFWYGDISQNHPAFQGAQRLAIEHGWIANTENLNFTPHAALTKKQVEEFHAIGLDDVTTTYTRADAATAYQDKSNVRHSPLY